MCTPLVRALLVVVALVAVACSSDAPAPTQTTAPASSTSTAEPAPTTTGSVDVSVSATAADHNPLGALVTVELDRPAQVRMVGTSGDHRVETPRTAASSDRHELPFVGMRPNRSYELEVIAVGDDGAELARGGAVIDSGDVPEHAQPFELSVDDPGRAAPGMTLVEVNPSTGVEPDWADNHMMGIDHDGEWVYSYTNTGAMGGVKLLRGGTFLAHYADVGVREFDVLGNVVGHWRVAPEPPEGTPVIVDPVAVQGFATMVAGNEGDADPISIVADWVNLRSIHHEVVEMPDGNLLALSTAYHPVDADLRERFCPGDPHEWGVTSDVIVEFTREGEVLRTWDLWDATPIEDFPGTDLCDFENARFTTELDRDWTHANAVIYDEARDAVIVSVRHTDLIVALDHLDDEGPQSQVRWTLGVNGSLPLDGDGPFHPHATQIQDDGTLLLYDNGNGRPGTAPGTDNPPYSRAVLYEIDDGTDDPDTWSATQLWEHRTEDPVTGDPLYAPYIGDSDRVANGNVLIDHGGIAGPMPDPPRYTHARIIEVVPDGAAGGDIVWELNMGTADVPVSSYRSERIPSLYVGPLWVEA